MDDGDWQYIEKSETANQFTIEDKKEHKFYAMDNTGDVDHLGNISEASSLQQRIMTAKRPN